MERKGLCNTCNDDISCCFSRKSSVWQCEEFSDYQFVKTAQGKTPKFAIDKQQQNTEDTRVE